MIRNSLIRICLLEFSIKTAILSLVLILVMLLIVLSRRNIKYIYVNVCPYKYITKITALAEKKICQLSQVLSLIDNYELHMK